MKGPWKTLLLLISASGCAAGASDTGSPPEPLSWPEGLYYLEAEVEYQQDTEWGNQTASDHHHAELTVHPGGFLRLNASSGICEDPLPSDVQRDRSRGQRTFRCNDATYVIKPVARTIRGEVRVKVLEGVRRRGSCLQYNYVEGQQVCVAYSYVVVQQTATKNVRLRVERTSISIPGAAGE